MSCCFILLVTGPEIVSIETATLFTDCSSHSCGHRNVTGFASFLLALSQGPGSISYSRLLPFPHLVRTHLSFSLSLPQWLHYYFWENFDQDFLLIYQAISLHSTCSWGLASISPNSGGCAVRGGDTNYPSSTGLHTMSSQTMCLFTQSK